MPTFWLVIHRKYGIARELRGVVLSIMPEAREVLDRSARIIGYGFGPGYADLICTIIPSRTGVKLGIVGGAALADPTGLMEGAGRRHRHVALAERADVKKPGLKPLLRAAVARWKARSNRGG